MTCDDIRHRLTAYVDGDLDDTTARAVRGHLRACATCRTAAADELAVRDAVARLPAPEVPRELWTQISTQLAAGEVADSRRSRWWLRWQVIRPRLVPAVVVAAAAAVAVLTVVRRAHREAAPVVAPAAPSPSAPALAIADPVTPSVRRDCDLHAATAGGDATGRGAALGQAVERCYQAAVDELLSIVDLDRPTWPRDRAQVFDAELDAARHAVTTAAAGRPRERAWQAVIQLLQRAVVAPVVAQVTP